MVSTHGDELRLFNSTFLKENTVKLISDNIFPSEKIRSYVNIPAIINDVQLNQEESF